MSSALVPQSPIIEYQPAEAAIAELTKRYGATAWVVTSPEGMEAAREARRTVREYRYDVETKRKEVKAEVLERGRLIDAEAKRITEALLVIETPIHDAIQVEEKRMADEKAERDRLEKEEREAKERAERDRIFGLRDRIAAISAPMLRLVGKPVAVIAEFVAELERLAALPGDFQEMQSQAEQVIADTLESARGMHARAVEHERRDLEVKAEQARIAAERAELARLRAEQEQRDTEARARIAREEAEAKKKRDDADAEAAAVRAAEEQVLRAERERIEAERRVKEEADKKAREKAEAKARAAQQRRQARMDGEQLLRTFLQRGFGELDEFKPVAGAINAYFAKVAKKGAAA
jgi:colicin import membrane protein